MLYYFFKDSSSNDNDNDDSNSNPTNDTTTGNGNRKKRSYVALTCYEVKTIMQDINDLVDIMLDNGKYRISTINRMCDYILDSPLTNDDCLESDNDPLKSEIDDLEDKIQSFYTKIQQEIVNEVVTGMCTMMSQILESRNGFRAN